MFQRIVFTLFLIAYAALPYAAVRAEEIVAPAPKLPLSGHQTDEYATPHYLTIAQERAKFDADQRQLQMNFNRWIGYSPLRPHMNASYMSNRAPAYYLPSRGYIVSTGFGRSWYW